jgi:hypothetical protein
VEGICVIANLGKLSRTLLILIVTVAMSTVIDARVAEPAKAAACQGYVHNNQYSRFEVRVHGSDTGYRFLLPGMTWNNDRAVAWVQIRTFASATVRYTEAGTGRYLGTDQVTSAASFSINPCHEAWIITPAIA